MSRLPKLNVGDVVYFEWIDAYIPDMGWSHEQVVVDSMRAGGHEVVSVGIFLHETDEYLAVVGSSADDGAVVGSLCVPKGWIKRLKVLVKV